jgi:hypothetical protein
VAWTSTPGVVAFGTMAGPFARSPMRRMYRRPVVSGEAALMMPQTESPRSGDARVFKM